MAADVTAEVEANLNKPMVYVDDEGRAIYRASALGMCSTAFIAVRMGFEPMAPPESMQRRFDEGHLHEDHIIQRLNSEYGIEVFGREREVTLWLTPTVGIRGHIDGEAVGVLPEEKGRWDPANPLHRLEENKTMSSKAFAEWVDADWPTRWKKYPGYAMQVTALGEAAGFTEVVYAVKDKESGQMDVKATSTAAYPMALIKAKVLGIEAHVRQGLPLPEECNVRSWPCPVFYIGPCGEEKRDTLAEREAEIVLALAKTYDANKIVEANAKKAKETARDQIKKHLPMGGKFDAPEGWKIAWTKPETTVTGTKKVTTLDLERLRAENPELIAKYETTETVDTIKSTKERLVVTPPKKEGAGWS